MTSIEKGSTMSNLNRTEPVAEVMTVTPELAAEWLAANTHNRGVKPHHLAKVARAMENDEWKLNGEAIKIATDGTILDGQHRLLAIVKTGKTITTFVILGLESETQETMDGGSPRSASDVLKLRGERNVSTLAAIARKVRVRDVYGIRAATSNSYTVTTAEIVRTVDEYPVIREYAGEAGENSRRAGLSASLLGFLMFVLYDIDADDAEYFFATLASGENIAKGNPIFELRAALRNVNSVRGEKSMTYIAAITIKAWNKYRAGESVGLLRFTPGGATPDQFPTPN